MAPASTRNLHLNRRAVVASFAELCQRPLADGTNALCWPRALAGDFGEVARAFAPARGVTVVSAEQLRDVALTAAGRLAADTILLDLDTLHALGWEPALNCIASYPRDERGLPMRTDVMSFHADRAPHEVDTWLCTYWGKSTEGLDNDDAHRRIDAPAVRAALLHVYGGDDDAGFAAFITDGSFDLHYDAIVGAVPFSLGVGHLWRLAVAWPGCPVPPCLHRAPTPADGDATRLLLIC